jgi:hypothetical protein
LARQPLFTLGLTDQRMVEEDPASSFWRGGGFHQIMLPAA